jgi:predicted XRE-type DNA-binding protein
LEKGKTKRTTKLTVDSILTQDNVKTVIAKLIREQKDIAVMVCIYRNRHEELYWKVTEGISIDQIITMLEQTKICLLTQEEE